MIMSHKRGFHKQQGVVAIEFAMGLPVFLFMCFAWLELCYLAYISALTDYVVAHAGRNTKSYIATKGTNPQQFYQDRFKDILTTKDSFWAYSVDVNKFKINISYFNDIKPLLSPCVDKSVPLDKQIPNRNCLPEGKSTPVGNAIAIYSVEYQYRPLIIPMFSGLNLKREIIAIQEHERCRFDISGDLNCDS